jgi:hypothetical protein
MEELMKSLSNININSQSVEQIGRYWLISQVCGKATIILFVIIVSVLVFTIAKKYGTGAWRDKQ